LSPNRRGLAGGIPFPPSEACARPASPRGADAGGGRYRLRRHRHQPAVHAQDHLRSCPRPGPEHTEPARHRVPDLLGPDDDRVAQIRHAGAACRQPRRGRHHGADGARAELRHAHVALALRADGAGRVRRDDVLRRQRDHARDLRAGRDRGSRSGDARPGKIRRAADDRRAGRPVQRAAPRHGRHRPLVRADHGRVVRRAGRHGRHQHRAGARDPAGAESAARVRVHAARKDDRVRRAGRRRAGVHGRRGAVRGHGPLRQETDPLRVVHGRVPRARAELPGPGRPVDHASGSARQPVLPPAGQLERTAARAAVDDGDRDRVAGHDLRHVLDDAPGHRPGPVAAHARDAHVGKRDRPDLHPGRELAAADRRAAGGRRLRFVRQAGRRLRHRGDGDHVRDDDPHLLRDPLPLAPAAVAVLRRHRLLHGDGHHAVLGQHAEAAARRLVPAAARRDPADDDADVEARARTRVREPGKARDPARGLPAVAVRRATRPRGRHRHLPARRNGRRAARAAAQPAAQQGAARARRVPHGAHPRGAVRARKRAGRGRPAGPQLLPAERVLRLQGRSEHPGHPAPVLRLRPRIRDDGDVVLHRAPDRDLGAGPGHDAVARAFVRGDAAQCPHRGGLLPDPDQPRDRARHAGRDLTGLQRHTNPPQTLAGPVGKVRVSIRSPTVL
ncbi:hypothetical protein Lal_00014777, partial [Lupinus albus]